MDREPHNPVIATLVSKYTEEHELTRQRQTVLRELLKKWTVSAKFEPFADDLGIDSKTLRTALQQFEDEGLVSLNQTKVQGFAASITEKVEDDIREVRQDLGTPEESTRHRQEVDEERVETVGGNRSTQVSLGRIMNDLTQTFVGRESELHELDEALYDSDTNVIVIEGPGGRGKTALVNRWVQHLGEQEWGNLQRVFDWSFFSQGFDDRASAIDDFLTTALDWFPGEVPDTESPRLKVTRLVDRINDVQTLLILDGTEPLQYPPGQKMGEFRESPVQHLVRGLAHSNNGLCVITTRRFPGDLLTFKDRTVSHLELGPLDPDVGAHLLRNLGVKGPSETLEEVSKEYDGDCLSLTLLGSYLTSVYEEAHIEKRHDLDALTRAPERGERARRILDAYEDWFGESPEKDLLRILGLFDRQVDVPLLASITRGPVIPDLTSNIGNCTYDRLREALRRLDQAGVLNYSPRTGGDVVDTHALIREHFSDKLQRGHNEAWKEANRRLHTYLQNLPDQHTPTEPAQLKTLFRAVVHGCRAGLYEETYRNLVRGRLMRGDEYYAIKIKGLYSSTLSSLSEFLVEDSGEIVNELEVYAQADILSMIGYCLWVLGQTDQAITFDERAKELVEGAGNWQDAARMSCTLADLYVVRGRLEDGLSTVDRSIEFAKKHGADFERMLARATKGYVLHQIGQENKALQEFEMAENVIKQDASDQQYLSSVAGYRYCDLLLSLGRSEEVLERTHASYDQAKEKEEWNLVVGLDQITRGKALMLDTGEGDPTSDREGLKAFNHGIHELRKAVNQDDLCRALIDRADAFRRNGRLQDATRDLDEAFGIAEDGDMTLLLADHHLGRARLLSDEGRQEKAMEALGKAESIIDSSGYGRREAETARLSEDIER